MIRETLERYWNQWNERERRMVVIAGIVLACYLCYAIFYAPLNDAVTKAQAQLTADRDTLLWMQSVRQQSQQTHTPQITSSGQLLSTLGQQLSVSAFHQFVYQLEQTASGDIQLSFDEVPYNVFLVWLKKFHAQYAFTIKQLSAERTQTPGMVKLQLIIAT